MTSAALGEIISYNCFQTLEKGEQLAVITQKYFLIGYKEVRHILTGLRSHCLELSPPVTVSIFIINRDNGNNDFHPSKSTLWC